MRPCTASTALLGGCAVLITATIAPAVPTTVQSMDLPNCDPLLLPPTAVVDELGLMPPFPPDEAIAAFFMPTQIPACPGSDNPAVPNALVRMTNLTPSSFFDVFYVADPFNAAGGTTISNFDGVVNAGQAFRIDTLGMNRPLIGESILVDGIFQPGEDWTFIIDDYFNSFGLPPSAFDSIGVGFASAGPPSTGSIIAMPVPEPGAIGLAAAAGAMLLNRRRPRAPTG